MRVHKSGARILKMVAVVLLGVIVAVSLSGCARDGSSPSGANSSDGPTILKVGHVADASNPYHKGLEKFAQLVDQKTQGKVKIEIFANGQLGNERDMIEGVQMGTIDMVLTATAPMGGFLAESNVFDLPYLFQNADQAHRALDGPVGTKFLKEKLPTIGLYGLAFWENGFRHIFNSKKAINNLADLRGMKLRVQESTLIKETFNTLGAAATPMAFSELYTGLEQGTVVAAENSLLFIKSQKFYEVCKNLALTYHFYNAVPLIMSKSKFESLPKDIQTALEQAAVEARDYERGLIKQEEDQTLKFLLDQGVKITNPDLTEWRNAVKPIYDKYGKQYGQDLVKQLQEAQ